MKLTMLSLLFTVLFAQSALSQVKKLPPKEPPVPNKTTTTTAPVIEDPSQEATVVVPETPKLPTTSLRGLSQFTGNVHFSALSTWVPLKYGISVGYLFSEYWTIEGEYTRKNLSAGLLGVDFGGITDSRYGAQARWYPTGNSFNLIMGLYRSEFSAELGSSILSRIGAPSGTMIRFTSFGPQVGLANRWQWDSGFTFGIDWLVAYIPLFGRDFDDEAITGVSNPDDRSDLDRLTSSVRNIPQFDVLKLTLGYTF